MRDAVIAMPKGLKARLERFTSHERLSELFRMEVVVLCEQEGVDFFPLLGEGVTITVFGEDGPIRYFHGLLYETEFLEDAPAGFRHRLELRPWPFPLSRNLNFKTYQNMDALEIVKRVMQKYDGKIHFDDIVTRKKREYCVQFRESDFSFISRLLEEEGIYYYFEHEEGSHTMVFSDGGSPAGFHPAVVFKGQRSSNLDTEFNIWRWSERVATSAESSAKLRNFDFVRPDKPQEHEFSSGELAGGEKAVVYDYPAPSYLRPDDGLARTERTMEAARAERRLYFGQGYAPGLACGHAMTLLEHPVGRFNQEYLIVGLNYSIEAQTYRSAARGGDTDGVQIEVVPKATHWRPAMRTPRPTARGPETAIVVGPSGETIYTDEYGRVKVCFHWDMDQPSANSTCWIRVSHASAGAGFGSIILPRIGQEVIVDFLDGDPDRPIITGRVYNNSRVAAYKLPDHKTRSVWRSQTVGETGQDYAGAEDPPSGAGWNEIRMEDKSGVEEIWTHAQRNLRTSVRLDEDRKVGRDQTERVGRDRTTAILRNDKRTVETGDLTLDVAQGKRTTTIKQDDTLTISQGNKSTTISLGNYSIKADAGAITIEAMQKIELKVGGNSILIDQTGITIKALMIKQEAQIEWSSKGLMTKLQADVQTTIKGAIVMIN